MTTAERIAQDIRNTHQGEVQHHRLAEMADKEPGVKKDGFRKVFYKFLDGSLLIVDHTLGNYDVQ